MGIRNSSGYNEVSWTGQINKLLTGLQGDPTDLPSVFIDTFYTVGPSQFATLKFRENTERLLQYGIEKRNPFQCKDINMALQEIGQAEILNRRDCVKANLKLVFFFV